MIPKQILNLIRGCTRENTKGAEKTYSEEEKDIKDTLKDLHSGDTEKIRSALYHLITKYNIRLKFLTSEKRIIDQLAHHLARSQEYIEMSKLITTSLSKDGINRTTYSFPIFFTTTTSNSPFFNYLTISGIKYNGEHKKTNSRYMNKFEEQLHNYEKELAKLIEDDFSISAFNQSKFFEVFSKYLDFFIKNSGYDIKDYIKHEVLSNMKEYLLTNVEFIQQLKQDSQESTKQTTPKRYQSFAQTINPETKQEANTSNKDTSKKEQEEQLNRRLDLLQEIGFDNWTELYNQARISDNEKATEIIKNINFWLDWLLTGDEDLRQELIEECSNKFSILESMFKVDSDEKSNVVYFKNSRDNQEYPAILDSIRETQRGNYKSIESSLNKLLSGNFFGREVQGNLPVKVVATNGDFKIFYTVINDVVIIIDGFNGEKGYDRIKRIANSPDFLRYYQEVKTATQNGKNLPGEDQHTDLIKSILKRTGITKKRINTSTTSASPKN